jgi:DUF3048 family protein
VCHHKKDGKEAVLDPQQTPQSPQANQPSQPETSTPAPAAPAKAVADPVIKSKLSYNDLTPEQKKRLWLIVGGAVAVILIIGGGIYAATRTPSVTPDIVVSTPPPTPTPSPTPPIEQASALDGVIVPYALSLRHPLAIMIENAPDARPQAGLTEASIIYEAIAEGGITRFMAIYGHSIPEKVGPVRSARPYYVQWAQEYNRDHSAYYTHVGGSPDALNMIKSDGIYDLNQFSIGTRAFQRIPKAGVATEHTMYTYPNKLYDVAKSLGYAETINPSFRPWQFKDDVDITNRPDAQTITIPFSSPTYSVKYVYDKASNTYKRYLANIEHKDANNSRQLAPKNIVVEFVSYSTVDGKGRQRVGMIGEGTGKAFFDGKVIDIKWKKEHAPERTIYSDAATGAEIQFNRGQFFIEAPKLGSTVTVQ